jgi:hypothetical protein
VKAIISRAASRLDDASDARTQMPTLWLPHPLQQVFTDP